MEEALFQPQLPEAPIEIQTGLNKKGIYQFVYSLASGVAFGPQISHWTQSPALFWLFFPLCCLNKGPLRDPSSHSPYFKFCGKNIPLPDSCRAGSRVFSGGHAWSLGLPPNNHRGWEIWLLDQTCFTGIKWAEYEEGYLFKIKSE